MDYTPNNSDNSIFPPHIDNTRLTLHRTACDGGSDVVMADGLLCVIGFDQGGSFRIYDVRGHYAEEPLLLGQITGLGNMRQIEVSGNLAVVTARECGLYLIDFADPKNPRILCHYNTVEFATGLAICGKYVFIGCRSFGVEIIDISAPDAPRHMSVIRAGEVQSITVADGILYTGSWGERQVNIIDVRDVLSPKKLATIPLEGRGDGLLVRDGLLYAAFGQHLRPSRGLDPAEEGYGRGNGFAVWDVSDPASPKQLSATLFPHRYYCCNWDMWDVTLSGHWAILSHTFNGVWIYDITDPTSPRMVDHTAIVTDKAAQEMITMNEYTLRLRPMILPFDYTKVMYAPVSGVAVSEGRLYIAPQFEKLHVASGEYFLPEKENAPSVLVGDYYDRNPGDDCSGVLINRTGGQFHAAAYLGGLVWAACGMDGIRVYETERLSCVGHIPAKGFVTDIRAAGGRLYTAAGTGGAVIYQPDAVSLRELGRFTPEERPYLQIVPSSNCRYAMVHTDSQHLTILDIADPASPKPLMLEHYAPGLIYHRHITTDGVDGRYYGCYWNGNYTRWYDLSGDGPVLTEWKQKPLGFGDGITGLPEPYQALVVYRGGYAIYDIRNELNYADLTPLHPDKIRLRGKPVVNGNTLTVTDRLDGNVVICDISDRASPKLIRRLNFSGHPDIACPVDGGVVLPLGHQGLALVPLN